MTSCGHLGHPWPNPILVVHSPPPHSENTLGVCPGAEPQDRGTVRPAGASVYSSTAKGTLGPLAQWVSMGPRPISIGPSPA